MARQIFIVFALIVASSAHELCCGPNESVAECGHICEPSCTNPKPEICPAIACSEATTNCRCDEGFVRNPETQECVRLDECPCDNYNCGANESVDKCGTLCEPSCTNPKPEICATVECSDATTNCRCNEGFVRDENSKECIPLDKCPCDNCGDNESMNKCGTLCEPSCKNPKPEFCPTIACTNATANCRCNEGFVRDDISKQCIPFDNCPCETWNCGANESVDKCGTLCEPSCTNPKPEICATVECSDATTNCRCDEGFVRDENSKECIPLDKCPCDNCGDNESMNKCGTLCEPSCKNPKPEFCPTIACTNATANCRCDEGFVRDDISKECIPFDKCPCETWNCGANESVDKCGTLCEPSCTNPKPEICATVECSDATTNCRCNEGFVRDEESQQCMPLDKCPCDNCGDNESMNKCGKLCEPSCTNPNPRVCPKIACTNYTTDCRCDKGYYRDTVNNLCVPFDKCTVCGPNEQLGNCGRICEGNCTHPEPSVECAATSRSGNACQCKEGFVRDPITDKCIPQSECPPKQCKPFEIYAACGTTCEGTCENPWLPEICTRIRCAIQDCRCDLDSGYVRDEATGKCVAIGQCGSRCPCNSEPKVCGSICEPTCKNPIERLCKIDPSSCRVDCRCSKGFVRDETSNECIKPENCC